MNSDFKDLFHLFNDKKVKYLVVGGYAVIKYSQPRYTGDIDIWVEPSEKNASKVYVALQEFGAPVSTLTVRDFAEPGYFFQMGIPPSRVDILMSVSGLEFSRAWEDKDISVISEVPVNFISKADLIKAKRAAGRAKDLADLETLLKSDTKDRK